MATDTDLGVGAPTSGSNNTYGMNNTSNWATALAGSEDGSYTRAVNHTDYYAPGASPNYDSWTNLSNIPTYVVINSIKLRVHNWISGSGGGTHKAQYNLSGGSWTDMSLSSSLTHTTDEATMSRPGGGSWSRSDIANIDVRGYANGDATRTDRYAIIDSIILRVNWDYITLLSLTASAATSITTTSATLPCSYNANGDGDTEWRIMYKASGGSYDDPSWTASSNTGSNSVSRDLSSLSPGTLYYYKLQARNSANTVQESAEGSFTTTASTGGLILFF